MKELFVLVPLVVGFATLVTVHLSLAFRLFVHGSPRWRGPVALVVPPLAVVWGYHAGWRRSAVLWVVALLVYVAALIAARS